MSSRSSITRTIQTSIEIMKTWLLLEGIKWVIKTKSFPWLFRRSKVKLVWTKIYKTNLIITQTIRWITTWIGSLITLQIWGVTKAPNYHSSSITKTMRCRFNTSSSLRWSSQNILGLASPTVAFKSLLLKTRWIISTTRDKA